MKILSLNIRSGGGVRTDAILAYLNKIFPDIVVLTEFRKNVCGDRILAWLKQSGFSYQVTPTVDGKKNTVIIAGKHIKALYLDMFPNDWSAAAIRTNGINIIGVYFPQEEKKQPVFDWFLHHARDMQKTVLIGDFNTGLNDIDRENPRSVRFHCQDDFSILSTETFIDAYRYDNPKKRTYSWYSVKNNGFRIDHVLLTRDLVKFLGSVFYDHSTRSTLTDHSGLIVELLSV